MTRTHKTARTLACVATCLLLAAVAAQATAAKQPSSVGRGFGFAYDPAHEITLVGTLQGVVTHPAPGSPVGLHLLVSSSGKVVDAHIGPFLSRKNKQALRTGQIIQITGVNEKVHGKDVLLARQLIFDGREVKVRNERGFLFRDHSGRVSHRKTRDGQSVAKGGIQ